MEHQHTGLPVRRPEEKRVLGVDPVCGMKVFEKPDAIHRVHGGATYYFCNPRCAEKFDADPGRFINAPGSEPMRHARSPARAHARRRPVHLPDAPRDREERAGKLSALRDGARAANGRPRGAAKPRVGGHDPTFLGEHRPRGTASPHRDGGHGSLPEARAVRALGRRGCSSPLPHRWCSGAGGRSSCGVGTRSCTGA